MGGGENLCTEFCFILSGFGHIDHQSDLDMTVIAEVGQEAKTMNSFRKMIALWITLYGV